MKPQTLSDGHTMPNLWSDLHQAWARTFASAWQPADVSDRIPLPGLFPWHAAWDYWVDACQRTVLFWDVLRQRSEQYYAEKAKATPHVLSFDLESNQSGSHSSRSASRR